MARYSDVAGVRIIPPVIEFNDTEANVANRINITVKNVAKTSKAIRYYGPQNTKVFSLKVQNPEKPVAPGLEVPALIEFLPLENILYNDRLMLTVDDAVVEIPIRAVPCQPKLVLNGPIDFGNVVASSKVISREITLANHGSKAGDYKIRYTGSRPITIMPPSGTVPPGSAQIIKVEYVTKTPGRFDEKAKVKLDGHAPTVLQIKGNVVEASLELLNPETEEPLDCVTFGAAYYGTDRTESAILFNNGPEPVCFVAVLNEDALGQEVGVDLTKSTAATLAAQIDGDNQKNGQMNELTSLVTAIPNQGILGPYEKVHIYFRFSPRWNAASQGFKCSVEHAPRKDFALFMQLKIIGASKGFLNDGSGNKSNVEGVSLEVALTATALPVMLSVNPQTTFDFGECPVKEHVDTLCTLMNTSDSMPVTFQFRRVAHFTSHPTNGKILPGETQDVIFSFAPNQVGTFKPTQYVDVIGQVADNRNPFIMHLQVIHTVPIQFIGVSDPTPFKKKPVFNAGITPKISNEVGMYVDTRLSSGREGPSAAMLNSQGTKLHRHKSMKDRQNENEALIAFPNDRAGSIRPSDPRETYQTIFTRKQRHTFVDPDYAYTDEEAEVIKAHKEYYLDFINQLRENRRNKTRAREFEETNNDVDIAMKPAAGLKPKKLKIEEVKPDPKPPTPPNSNFKLLSTKELADNEMQSSKNTKDGLNAVPTSLQEKADCSRVLSPQELHQIIVGPPTIDFGQVCLRSISKRELNIVNNLDQFIHIVVHVDCRELRQTSPLSQVVPPRSKAILPLIFDSGNKGQFQRSLDFTINGFYKNHITVFAEVVPVAIELSTEDLVLEPSLGLPADAGVRGVINLRNKLNLAAEFTWTPILGERGTAFSIRPATGVVEACKDLDCEVVFHPSFMAPEEGYFALQVHGGNTLKLKCTAKLGPTNVQFIDRRVMFGQVPLHLTTTRIAMIRNNSLNHAFFQVMDPNPFPGLSVSPLHGVIPVGGTAQLKVNLTPNAVIKFDTRVQVAIRGSKTLELRMGGTVEPPVVDIDLQSFNFGGVYCGSKAVTEFRLANRTNTKTRMEFDLSRYADFQLAFPGKQGPEDFTFQLMNPGVYSVTLDASEIIYGELLFQPTEIASYDFVIPVTINQTGAPSPSATPFPPTPAPSQKNSIQHIINPRPVHVTIATPRRKVIATALRQPLQLSHNKLEFVVSPGFHELSSSSGIGHTKSILLVNNSDGPLKWAVNLAEGNDILEQGVFKFLRSSGMPYLTQDQGGVEGTLDPGQTQSLGVLFCPDKPGHYEVTLPIVINEEWDRPYQFITIVGELKSPKIWFSPVAIVLTPVPLETEISAEFQLFAANYTKASSLDIEVPTVECDDGSTLTPLSVSFSGSREIQACCGDEGNKEPFTLRCQVTFVSSRPVSFSQPIRFIDCYDTAFSLMVTATSDNCLLTCYPFLAQHRTDHQIVCEQNNLLHQGTTLKGRKTASRESVNVGEAVLVPCTSPPRPASRPSTTATSSNFEITTSSYEGSSQSLSESTFPSTPREGALNKFHTDSDGHSRGKNDSNSRSLASALFPEEDSEEGIFHTEVLLAVQRWYSSQGWPGGPHPISIPHSLRNGISKKPIEEKTKNAKGGTWEANNLKKEFKTVYDMVSHLSGKQVPGIPINNPLPSDPTARAKQVYWQHSTLLIFLKTQGACVSNIKPEYLMEPGDYKHWVALQKEIEIERHKSGHREAKMKTEEEEAIEDQVFEAVSKRAWTDILLQLLKTVVLARITPRAYKHLATPYRTSSVPNVDPDPLCSNVYSLSERILLLWLNHQYEQQRELIWSTCNKGGVPPSRWVVNFDFDLLDGLVLAAAVGAHAPFLIKTHLHDMYTKPATAEQCLHNALKVVSALQVLGIDYDIQAIDITDPNPISLLLLVVHLFNNLPHYLPKSNVDFVGALHTMILRQVRLSNPSSKPLTYQAMVAGRDAGDFCLPKGYTIVIPPKSTHNLSIEFTSRFLRPAEANLVLVGRRQGSNVGSTLVFNLRTQIDNITPKTTIRFESPCYELNKIPIEVTNPFPQAGKFKVVLVESRGPLPGQSSDFGKKKKKKAKKIKSRTNHGQNRPETPEVDSEPEQTNIEDTEEADVNAMSAFHISFTSVQLEANATQTVELDFLPFQTGKRQCSVIFINEEVGEFLYSVEANATLPLPALLPFKPSPYSVRISSAAAAGGGRGMFGGDESIVYWKCECGQRLKEALTIPITNPARENALVLAAQQHMSADELQRRLVTGTLASATLTAKTVGILSARPGLALTMPNKSICLDADWTAVNSPSPRFERSSKGATFKVEIDSEHYTAPDTIVLPSPLERRPSPPGSRKSSQTRRSPTNLQASGLVLDEGSIQLPVTFMAHEPGHYPCRIVLRSQDDVRVYHIECTVIPEGSEAQVEFASPVHQPVTQNIPIVNPTNHDWPMCVTISGEGFVGPSSILAKAYQTTQYPLIFRPKFEGEISGQLVMMNTADNVEHKFALTGSGERPLPLEQLVFHTTAKQSVSKKVHVPNVTQKKLLYKVESDLEFVSGKEIISVLPGKSVEYELTVAPLKRGAYKGIVSFVAITNAVNDGYVAVEEIDSDGDEVPDDDNESSESMDGYRVWYAVDVFVDPPPAEKTLRIECACQKKSVLEVGLTNPLNQKLPLSVSIAPNNQGLSGSSEVLLPPNARGVYVLEYAPAIVGKYTASLIFYHPLVGEFWYHLELSAEPPVPTIMPKVECELGRWVRQYINLNNPTDELLLLVPTNSNTNNFVLERDNDQPIELKPHSNIRMPVTFMPSTLGEGEHRAKISFHCEQLGAWEYILSGHGRLPHPQDPVSITAMAGSNSTLIIPFRNPLDITVYADIELKDREPIVKGPDDVLTPESPFCLLIKHTQGIRLGPKSTVDIPVSFAPEDMKRFDALVTVTIRKESNAPWTYSLREESPYVPVSVIMDSNDLHTIRWEYPINGYPELTAPDTTPALVVCQARERIEERLEVTLSGVAPSAGGPKRGIKTRARTPAGQSPKSTDGVLVGEAMAHADEFLYELVYKNSDISKDLEPAVVLKLVRTTREKHTGLVMLLFNIIYAPYKTMLHDVELLVKGATGGLWKFPVRFVATEPEPDDVITISAVGLNKEASVAFRLTSQARHPMPYNAYFVAGSDTEFGVSPATGELMPDGTNGSLIKVNFVPSKYGKVYQGKLVVQTPDMQWTYSIRGVLPEYDPPRGQSSRPMAGPHIDPRRRLENVNYVRDNLKLTTTAVSSPIKGVPIIRKKLDKLVL